MSNTRREFLQSGAITALGALTAVTGARASSAIASSASSAAQIAAAQNAKTDPNLQIQVPQMKFGNAEIGRLVLGCNPFNGGAHFNSGYSSLMRDWFTAERAVEVMHRATSFGINAFNYSPKGRCPEDWERFVSEGGKMHLIAGDSTEDGPEVMVKKLQPHALHRQGEVVDVAYRNGKMNDVREWCKRTRDLGVMTGVATHKPEVIAYIEGQGWDVDYFCGCVYNRTRSDEEWRKVLNGELMEMSREIYMQSDPPRMYKVMRQTPKPCFAFKVLAAGRIADGGTEQAFRTAFTSIKPIDGVWVGIFPKDKDQLKENAEIVQRILTGECNTPMPASHS
jgi:hypothetical protein